MPDQDIVQDLMRDEGLRLKPYRDTVGKLTIGYGRNLDDVGISDNEAITLLQNDIHRTSAYLDAGLPWWRNLPAPQQRAILNMAFNVGMKKLQGFQKMLAALQCGDWNAAADEALNSQWAQQVGARATRVATLLRGDTNV